jgi:hypothetical protein
MVTTRDAYSFFSTRLFELDGHAELLSIAVNCILSLDILRYRIVRLSE